MLSDYDDLMDAKRLLQAVEFAAERHRYQKRKDAGESPYINHPIGVATVLAVEAGIEDEALLMAAVLHDTVEDTKTSIEELEACFGAEVAGLVSEVTDDKSLQKQERKRLQVKHAQHASAEVRQLKIADKICNVRDLAAHPPVEWSVGRKLGYVDWASEVVEACSGVNPQLEAAFDRVVCEARRVMSSADVSMNLTTGAS